MKIAIASDHGGVGLKSVLIKHLSDKNIDYVDCGTYTEESCITLTMQKKRAGWCRMARQRMLSLFAVPVSACASQLIK